MNTSRRPGWQGHRGPAVGARQPWPSWPGLSPLRLLRLLLLLCVCALAMFPPAPANGAPPAPWSEKIFDQVRREYGEPAAQRLKTACRRRQAIVVTASISQSSRQPEHGPFPGAGTHQQGGSQ